jgi:putative solute:sodium symporter small subunit
MRDSPRQVLWHGTQRLTAWLLGAWLLVSLLGPWYAVELNRFQVLGFPLGFWVVGQGSLLAFLVIIVICIVCMERLEAAYQTELDLEDRPAAEPHGPAQAPRAGPPVP